VLQRYVSRIRAPAVERARQFRPGYSDAQIEELNQATYSESFAGDADQDTASCASFPTLFSIVTFTCSIAGCAVWFGLYFPIEQSVAVHASEHGYGFHSVSFIQGVNMVLRRSA
jgi:hypothetical protein